MSTIVHIPATSLLSGGCLSMSTSGNDDSLGSVGFLLTSTATSVSSGSVVNINVNAAQVEQSKAYVQSLSAKQQQELLDLLDEREQQLEMKETGNSYVKKIK